MTKSPRDPGASPFFSVHVDVVVGLGVGVGLGGGTFFVFKSLDNYMVYILCIDVYVCKRKRCTTKVLWVLKF